MIDVDALEDELERVLAANLGCVPVAKHPPKSPPKAAPAPPPAPKAAPPPPPRTEPKPFRARTGSAQGHQRAQNEEQQFRLVLERGDEDELYALLDDCRRRAYTYGELPWRAALTLLLADLGRRDEAARELEATIAECEGLLHDAAWLDVVTNLAEAAFLLGDTERAKVLHKWLAKLPDQVVVGAGNVCKGSLNRFQAHVAAVLGVWADADRRFRAAVEAHRALGDDALLARTLQQWGRSLSGRDDLLARRCLQESEELAAGIGLPWGRGARAGDPAVSTPA